MSKQLAIAFLLLLNSPLWAQQEYLVLHNGDTIYSQSIVIVDKYTRVHTDTGRIKIPSQDIREIYKQMTKHLVIRNPFVDHWIMYRVELDGLITFVEDDRYRLSDVDCLHFVVMDGEAHPMVDYHLSNIVWSKMATCKAFEEKFKAYKDKNSKRKYLLRNLKTVNKWKEMVYYYNRFCGEE